MPHYSKNYQTVDITEAVEIHAALIKKAGTQAGVRDFALLHSAIERPNATFDGKFLYPTVFYKAAALLQSMCLNHPFTDGNKRTAWMITKRFFFINNYHLKSDHHSAADFMVYVDNEKPDIKEIMTWLKTHSTPLTS